MFKFLKELFGGRPKPAFTFSHGKRRPTITEGGDCLTTAEVQQVAHETDIPASVTTHLATCEECRRLVEKAKTPS
ncbi:MAG: hypothetical protein JWN50_807 [Parcubacteria group bacterium]|nr:hypothetical protein [Parcubacteria group bacterium]